jgi:hypothetical protein
MLRFFQILFIVSLSFFTISVYTVASAKENKGIKISPSDIHEKCFEVLPTKVLYYSFKASEPIKFNLHYHLKEGTILPISGKATVLKGIFHPEKKQKIYCLEWKNILSSPVSLDYTYDVKDK